MIRQQRAKQFQPFDAMKGLSNALKDREERRLRVDKREISEEKIEELNETLARLEVGMRVKVEYYKVFHYIVMRGWVNKINVASKFLMVDEDKIFFNDIYEIYIADYKK